MSLSDKIVDEGELTWGFKEGFLDVEDVKEFIKELKANANIIKENGSISQILLFGLIDELAGKELTEND